MKIICVGRNYAEHIEELKNERPSEPVIFLKPETALLQNNAPFYYPEFSNDIHHEVEILVKINKPGKYIDERFAHKYYDEIGLGIDFTARDLQNKAREKGLPWDLAKGFNSSAAISKFIPKTKFEDVQDIGFSLEVNGQEKQHGTTSLMLFKIDFVIAYISRFIMLKKGDIIYTGTPKGVGPVRIGDVLEGFIENEKMLEFEIK